MTLITQSKSKQIGACSYSVEPLPWKLGRQSLVRLLHAIAPVLAKLDTEQLTGASRNTRAIDMFAEAMAAGIQSLTDEDLEYFENLYRSRTFVTLPDGRAPLLKDCPEHFASEHANTLDYFEWLYHCVVVTHGDFFKGALTRGSAFQLSKAPQTKDA